MMSSAAERKFKVLLTVHCFFPRHYHGTERYTLDLAKCLREFGHEVVVVTVNRYAEDATLDEWREYEFEGIRVLAIDLTNHFPEGITHTYLAPELEPVHRRILAQERPDIVHCCHLLYLGVNFISVAREMGLPVILSLTDFFGICWVNTLTTIGGRPCEGPDRFSTNCVRDFYSSRPQVANSALINRFLQLTRHALPAYWLFQLWANSGRFQSRKLRPAIGDIQDRRERIREHFVKADEYFVATDIVRDAFLRQGYDAAHFRKLTFGIRQPGDEDREPLRRRYAELRGPAAKPLVIGFVGQVARHKGILDLLAAFRQAKLENAELHVYGDLAQDVRVGARVREAAEADPRIKLQGTFSGGDIYRVLASIHVLVIPSTWHENAPLILLNALASRTILLVSSGKGLVEFVREGDNGHVFPMGDVPALAAQLRRLGDERESLLGRFDALQPYDRSPSGYAREIEAAYYRNAGPRNSVRFPALPPAPLRPVIFRKLSAELPQPTEFLSMHDDAAFLTVPLPEPRHLVLSKERNGIDLHDLPGFERARTIRLRVAFHQPGHNTFVWSPAAAADAPYPPAKVQRVNEPGLNEIVIHREAFDGPTDRLRWHPSARANGAKISVLEIALIDADGIAFVPAPAEPRRAAVDWASLSASAAALDPANEGHLAPVPPAELLQTPGLRASRRDYLRKGRDWLRVIDALADVPTESVPSVLEVSLGVPVVSRLLRAPRLAVATAHDAARAWTAASFPHHATFPLAPRFAPFDGGSRFARVLALNVLHTIPFAEWPEYLAAFANACEPGGLIAVSFPSYRVVAQAEGGKPVPSLPDLPEAAVRKASAALKRDQAVTLSREADGLPAELPFFTCAPLPPLQAILPASVELVRAEADAFELIYGLLLLRRL